jgi:hypothetical protein
MINGYFNRSSLNQKAAQKCVAFFIIFYPFFLVSGPTQKNVEQIKISEIKQKTTELMLKKDRRTALHFLDLTIENIKKSQSSTSNPNPNSNKDSLEQLYALKENILSVFLTQETQDAYEASASSLFQNSRNSEKKALKCLQAENTNLYCKWQYLKYLSYKNDPQFQTEVIQFKKETENLPVFGLLARTLKDQKSPKQISIEGYEKIFPILHIVFEFERSLQVKNYSHSKDLLQNLSSAASDYPDLTILRAQLTQLSVETSDEGKSDSLYKIYKKKCATLSPELTRKYYYDINLCHRGL